LFIALGVVLLVILIAVGGIVGFNGYRANAYNDAVALFDVGDYAQARDGFDKLGDYKDAAALAVLAQNWFDYEAAQTLLGSEDFAGAKEAFLALGDFEDSADQAELCQLNLDYLAAIESFDAGDFETALEEFTELAAVRFLDAATWKSKAFYAIAEGKLADGDRYGAYEDFKKLGSFEDSADRMKECTTEYPGSGEIYHNEGYVSTRSAIKIDGGNAGFVSYYKVYSGETLVSTIFLHAGQSCTIEVPPGDYTIKQATGTDWFGEEIMFGDEGYYEKMTYDNGNDYFNLGDNVITTITLSVSEGGNVGGEEVPRSNF
jgi:tetratricopeptide (TPR) repeat protein